METLAQTKDHTQISLEEPVIPQWIIDQWDESTTCCDSAYVGATGLFWGLNTTVLSALEMTSYDYDPQADTVFIQLEPNSEGAPLTEWSVNEDGISNETPVVSVVLELLFLGAKRRKKQTTVIYSPSRKPGI